MRESFSGEYYFIYIPAMYVHKLIPKRIVRIILCFYFVYFMQRVYKWVVVVAAVLPSDMCQCAIKCVGICASIYRETIKKRKYIGIGFVMDIALRNICHDRFVRIVLALTDRVKRIFGKAFSVNWPKIYTWIICTYIKFGRNFQLRHFKVAFFFASWTLTKVKVIFEIKKKKSIIWCLWNDVVN